MSEEAGPDKPSPRKDAAAKGGKPGSGTQTARRKTELSLDSRNVQLGLALAAGLILGLLIGALIFGGGDDGGGEPEAASAAGVATIVSPAELAAEAQSLGRPIYWAGPQGESVIELERTAEGNTSVRYIPEGEDAGGSEADFLTVVTYPYPDAYGALSQQAESGDVLTRDLPGGGIIISQANQPTNAYVAYRGEDYQVEIYDPRPGRALKLAIEGAVVPAG